MPKTIKVSVTLSLEVDPTAWAAAHFTSDTAPKVIREDVLWSMLAAAQRQEGVVSARLGMTNRSSPMMPS